MRICATGSARSAGTARCAPSYATSTNIISTKFITCSGKSRSFVFLFVRWSLLAVCRRKSGWPSHPIGSPSKPLTTTRLPTSNRGKEKNNVNDKNGAPNFACFTMLAFDPLKSCYARVYVFSFKEFPKTYLAWQSIPGRCKSLSRS